MDDIAAEIAQMRRIATNIIGFHALTEDETRALRPEKRVEYEAQVYAGGVELARIIARIENNLLLK